MWRAYWSNLKKLAGTWFFVLCCLLAFVCFLVDRSIYRAEEERFVNFTEYCRESEEWLLRSGGQYSWQANANMVMSSYCAMFLPLIGAFAGILLYFSEKERGYYRLAVVRAGATKYRIAWFLSAITVGSLILCAGYSLMLLAVRCLLPGAELYENVPLEYYRFGLIEYLKNLGDCVVFGAFGCSLFLLTLVLFRNRYLCISIPFTVLYVYNHIVASFSDKYYALGDMEKGTFWNRFEILQAAGGIRSGTNRWMISVAVVLLVMVIFVLGGRRKEGDLGA